jgi:hypothetical protein
MESAIICITLIKNKGIFGPNHPLIDISIGVVGVIQ